MSGEPTSSGSGAERTVGVSMPDTGGTMAVDAEPTIEISVPTLTAPVYIGGVGTPDPGNTPDVSPQRDPREDDMLPDDMWSDRTVQDHMVQDHMAPDDAAPDDAAQDGAVPPGPLGAPGGARPAGGWAGAGGHADPGTAQGWVGRVPGEPGWVPGEPGGGIRASFAELAEAGIDSGDTVDSGDAGDSADAGAGDPADDTSATVQTLQPLLLHSLADLREVWLPLLDAAQVRSITEIGSESGATTTMLVEALRRGGGGRLLVVDPDPGVVPTSGGGLDVEVIRGYSPEALDGHTPTDAYLIDGDHNYYTVSAELQAIQDACAVFGLSSFPLVVLHDVGWPAGRRDQYYNPDRIPAHARQPYSWDVGVRIDHVDAAGGGFRGEGAFAWALAEGGPRNGVRTAAEDFVAAHPRLRFSTVTAVFGLGVIVDTGAPWARPVTELVEQWASNTLLARMERNRIDLYLRVLQLQDDMVGAARARQREWARLDAERSRFTDVELQRLDRIAELEQALAAERRDAEQARAALADEPKLVHAARLANATLKEKLERTAIGKAALPAIRRMPIGTPGASESPAAPAGSSLPAGSAPGPALPPGSGSAGSDSAGSRGSAAGSQQDSAPDRLLPASRTSSLARWLPSRRPGSRR